MNPITIILIIIVAFLAGMEGILDEWEFHQPLVACTLIGIVSGHPTEGIMLGGSLQMLALGWANIGAAVAPDAALASVASAIIMVLALSGGTTDTTTAISTAIALAVPLSVAGLFLTMFCRTLAIPMATRWTLRPRRPTSAPSTVGRSSPSACRASASRFLLPSCASSRLSSSPTH